MTDTCRIDGCGGPSKTRDDLCNRHYLRLRRHGTTEAPDRPTIFDRLWAAIDQSDGADACWPWRRALNHYGYGVLGIGQRLVPAHRLALVFATDPEEDHQADLALHTCDNPPCCNPKHLYWGSAKDNAKDMMRRKRRTEKLLESQVAAIRDLRANGVKRRDVADRFGVTTTTISNITTGRTWGHLAEGESNAR